MKLYNISTNVCSHRWRLSSAALVCLIVAQSAMAFNVTNGVDVKVTVDNNNVDGGTPNPGFDAQNRQANETSVAISPTNRNIVAVGANDYRMMAVAGDSWLGFSVSSDGGADWFNSYVPGFGSDTSLAGLTSPLLGLDASGDPIVRFDAEGNLYVGGIAFNRNFDQEDLNNDTVAFVAKYNYTPGTPGGVSTPFSAANPPNFTYASTTIVDRGAVAFAVPDGQPFNFAGKFTDKTWMTIDTHPASACVGNVYYTYTKITGVAGSAPIVLSRSTDGGATFSEPKPITQRGEDGVTVAHGSNIAVAPDGTVYVVYRSFATSSDPADKIQVVRSDDCGLHFGNPVTATVFNQMPHQTTGLSYRTPTMPWIATDDTNPGIVYAAYMSMPDGRSDADIFVTRSIDGGLTWGIPARVNDDATGKHQFWPAITVSNGALHVAWFDLRDSLNSNDPETANDVLNVYYAATNRGGVSYPAFSNNVKVSDTGHQSNCRMFGGGTRGFHGDYIELAAYFDGAKHVAYVAWPDNRDVPSTECDLDPAAGPDSNNIGNRNQNIYADRLEILP